MPKILRFILFPLVIICIISGYAYIETYNFKGTVLNYVVVSHEYQSNEAVRKSDRKQLHHDERAYHHIPNLQFHNPKLGNMSLNTFDKYLDQRGHLKEELRNDKRDYNHDCRFNTKYSLDGPNPSRYEVHMSYRNMRACRDGWYISKKFAKRQFPHYEHEWKHHPNKMKKEQD